jgi:hypothetical protein
LGEEHPLFLTQYKLLPLHGGGGFLNMLQLVQLKGEHGRQAHGTEWKYYVAGVDLGGEEDDPDDRNYRRDSTVVTIAELDYSVCSEFNKQPGILIVEHYRWIGRPHTDIYCRLIDILKNVWKCRRVVVDATGIGEPVASFLKQMLGHKIIPFKFTEASKSEIGFNLLAAINAGRLKMYSGDGSEEYREFFFEMEKAKSYYRPNKTMNFYVAPEQGHDDFLMSTGLLVEAAEMWGPRIARSLNQTTF